MVLLLCVGTPLCGAFLLPLIGRRSPKLRNAAALAFVLAAFCLAGVMTARLLAGGEPLSLGVTLPLGLSMGFNADALALFMILTAAAVGTVIVVYSFGYMKEYAHLGEYYMMVTFFIGAMAGLALSTNLIELYLFWELSSLCSWRLIGFYRDETSVSRANKAFLVTVFGALVMLLGFLGVYGAAGTFELAALKGFTPPLWASALILVGILSKSASFPLHNWLPDAGVAPSPVTALLHAAVLVKIGVFAYARIFADTFAPQTALMRIVPIVAAVSALLSAGCALVATDIKRVVAYSTISQLAFILLGLSAGGKTGFVGGLLYILAHSVAKAGLFLCCGIVEHNTHTKDIGKMGGLARTMPKTAAAFLLCAFSVMGIPPFSGFFAKYLVIGGAAEAGRPWIAAVFILGAVMTVLYLLRLFVKVFLGPPSFPQAREGTREMVGMVVLLAALSLALGFLMRYPSALAEMAWEAIAG